MITTNIVGWQFKAKGEDNSLYKGKLDCSLA